MEDADATPLGIDGSETCATLTFELLNFFNENYVITRHASTACVISVKEKDEFGVETNQIMNYANFKQCTSHIKMCIGEKKTMVCAAPLWLEDSRARRYHQAVFYPTPPGRDPQRFPYQSRDRPMFNLFKGWPVSVHVPLGGTCETYLELLLHGMCSGVEADYEYLVNLMAFAVQRPDVKQGVSVIFNSGQGTGKGQAVTHFGALFGASFVTASQASHVTSHFNGFLRTALLLFVDEAALIDPKVQGIVKAMITEESQLCENKGLDAKMSRSFYDVWMASNLENCIRLDNDDRRCFMPCVSTKYQGDKAFFTKLNAEMAQGGQEALFSFLVQRDLTGFDRHERPRSERSSALLFEQKFHSMSSVERFIFHGLQNSEPPFDVPGKKISHQDLNASFNVFLDTSRDRSSESVPSRSLIRKLTSTLPGGVIDHGNSHNKRFKSFAPLPVLREAFQFHFKAPASIWD